MLKNQKMGFPTSEIYLRTIVIKTITTPICCNNIILKDLIIYNYNRYDTIELQRTYDPSIYYIDI